MKKLALLAALLLVVTSPLTAADWPQFLGPDRNGISSETGLLKSWPEDGPPVLWRTKGGVGMSGLAIADGRLVTLVQKDGRQFVVVHDAKTGELQRQVDVAPAYRNPMGDGPRATPTLAGDVAYVFTGQGVLAAVDVKSGEVTWSKNVVKELGGEVADYGMASSPLVVKDLVIVTPGAPGATVAAFDRKSGKLAWKTGNDPAGYSSPALRKVGGKEQVVVFAGASVLGLDLESGKLLWRHPYETAYECNIATPLAYEGKVFVSAGENHGSVLLDLQPKNGAFEAVPVWKSQGPRSVLRNEWQTSILLDGHLYGMDNVGSAGPVTHLTCVEADTGERVWQQLRFGKGYPVYADGKLFTSTFDGELAVVKAQTSGFEELGRMPLLAKTRQAPSLSDGRLYLRDDREIVCVDVRARE